MRAERREITDYFPKRKSHARPEDKKPNPGPRETLVRAVPLQLHTKSTRQMRRAKFRRIQLPTQAMELDGDTCIQL